jgi:proteasome activator subunit 4
MRRSLLSGQLLDIKVFDTLKPIIDDLLADKDKDKNKQRGAAEFIAGLMGGMAWPFLDGVSFSDTPHQDPSTGGSMHRISCGTGLSHTWRRCCGTTSRQRLSTSGSPSWRSAPRRSHRHSTSLTSRVQYMFFNRDPRRVQPLVDFVVGQFHTADWNTESSFDASRALLAFRAFYEHMGWKAAAWMPDALARAWPELAGEHDEVRAYIGELLVFSGKALWLPRVSAPTAAEVVRECRTASRDADLMGIGNGYHRERVDELVQKFRVWRDERLPGVRAFQSTYDKWVESGRRGGDHAESACRVGIAVCRWLILVLHDTNAVSAFQYILPLMVRGL